jgi:hypothetical protein
MAAAVTAAAADHSLVRTAVAVAVAAVAVAAVTVAAATEFCQLVTISCVGIIWIHFLLCSYLDALLGGADRPHFLGSQEKSWIAGKIHYILFSSRLS